MSLVVVVVVVVVCVCVCGGGVAQPKELPVEIIKAMGLGSDCGASSTDSAEEADATPSAVRVQQKATTGVHTIK